MSAPAHSPLPWSPAAAIDDDNRFEIFDATGLGVLLASGSLNEDEALATIAYAIKAANAHPLLIARLEAASHALRSYQFGNTATDLARDVADACDVVLAQMEAR